MVKRAWLLLAAAALPSAPASRAQPPAPAACASADYRRLDFWLGRWTVFNTADNVRYASSRVESIMAGCAIRETYDSPTAPGGHYSGTSYSGFDRNDGRWHQMYVDTHGSVTWYTGGAEGADMVLIAVGQRLWQRMTYRPQPDGSVRQIGAISRDRGATWQAGYDYTYRREGSAQTQ